MYLSQLDDNEHMKPIDRLIARLISDKIIPSDSYVVRMSGGGFFIHPRDSDDAVATSEHGVLELLDADTIISVTDGAGVRVLDVR